MQFTASEEYVKLVEQARALLSHSGPRPALDELHLRAMRALVAELERRKYAVTEQARKRLSATEVLPLETGAAMRPIDSSCTT